MNEHPKYLVLTPSGDLAGYTREDIMRCDLAVGKAIGEPAQSVWKLKDTSLGILYERTSEFDAWISHGYDKWEAPLSKDIVTIWNTRAPQPAVAVPPGPGEAESVHFIQRLADLCDRHRREQLPKPTTGVCVRCKDDPLYGNWKPTTELKGQTK